MKPIEALQLIMNLMQELEDFRPRLHEHIDDALSNRDYHTVVNAAIDLIVIDSRLSVYQKMLDGMTKG